MTPLDSVDQKSKPVKSLAKSGLEWYFFHLSESGAHSRESLSGFITPGKIDWDILGTLRNVWPHSAILEVPESN